MPEKTIFFDIETGPQPREDIAHLLPAFNPDEVKLGNLKDEEKIKEKLRAAEEKHRSDFFDNAALSPVTGKVICIGVIIRDWVNKDVRLVLGDRDEGEATIIKMFWQTISGYGGAMHQVVGFNSNSFDLPFLIKRSWYHNISVPPYIRDGKWWSKKCVDLRDDWTFGDSRTPGKLDDILKFLGLQGKNGSGKEFAALWENNREQALAYINNDIEQTKNLHDRIRYLPNPSQAH
jgi:predicted PolB exonuclease-like 3'-5' exonuclease